MPANIIFLLTKYRKASVALICIWLWLQNTWRQKCPNNASRSYIGNEDIQTAIWVIYYILSLAQDLQDNAKMLTAPNVFTDKSNNIPSARKASLPHHICKTRMHYLGLRRVLLGPGSLCKRLMASGTQTYQCIWGQVTLPWLRVNSFRTIF